MIGRVLVANRGEIACRIIRTLKAMGLTAVAVYSDADRHAAHVGLADAAVRLGPAPAAESYLDVDALLAACRTERVDAVHPGYGFLSENARFAERLEAEGIRFIGPRAQDIRRFGAKHTAREAAEAADVPLLPGTSLLASLAEAETAAAAIGFPLMLKSTAGGGGIGLQLCETPEALPDLYARVRRLAGANFGDDGVFLERYVATARHVEVQIFGDGTRVVSLGARDCSLQRRNQKVVEETPAPLLPPATLAAMEAAAIRLGDSVGYRSAGTVEFIYEAAADRFYFLEVNTRLQVEHPVTEAVTGLDLVEWMIRVADGARLPDPPAPAGHAIEARVYAEDPARDFRPSSGRIINARFPDVRVDTFVETGSEVPAVYDPLIAKIIVHGATREVAVARLADALAATRIDGIATNLDYLAAIARSEMFATAAVSTRALADFCFAPRTVEVLAPGAQSSLQDVPGRLGYWHVGVPPSGPMDPLSHRLANRAVGNAEDAAALEMTLIGPTLRFHGAATIALTGADMGATLDGAAVARFVPIEVEAGATLALGPVTGPGNRAYLAVAGGFDVPPYLGSRAAFMLGGFGGHAPGALKAGDVLAVGGGGSGGAPTAIPEASRPALTDAWTIGVLYGPHGAPDYFAEEDIAALTAEPYRVHVNSDRTGVRLAGPKPRWARPDGGEAGLHPSNIHDNAYAVGALDFTGDMPIILGPDGPSLGGFVCPFVVAKADLWILGQLKAGDSVRFVPLGLAAAEARERAMGAGLAGAALPAPLALRPVALEPAIRLYREGPIDMTVRRTGEDNLLVEFGDNVLDLELRVRAHQLMERIAEAKLPALIDVTPGIRSLQLHYDNMTMSEPALLDIVAELERELPPPDDIVVPSRVVNLPLAWDDSQTRLATERYQTSVRPDAPWCPWNLEFIRRINGLDSIDEVRAIVYGADYLVYGLGDVYLGAPVATPLDPRHRLVTTKYNPARTWTPQNAVGIGGAYLCIYGMEGPGGYQFVGRTVQVWNTWRRTAPFRDGVPWLLRFFDRIRFHPVSEADLLEMREAFPYGGVPVAIEEGTLSVAAHKQAMASAADEIATFRRHREAAFAAERARWEAAGLAATPDEPEIAAPRPDLDAPTLDATMAGIVWRITVAAGESVAAGDTVVVLEAMKMEIPIAAARAGRVATLLVAEGQMVAAGEALLTLEG
ncbi:urea carboxylase [Acuticoccus mangrovi]|uniref:Urea carboxylase n=1 Tax=Acuticoccus mangrovi TaxID=2796142 RepID=A0A934ISM6_9HYPH|nr:urea carboxylase [Acuticoccus mangrovi]